MSYRAAEIIDRASEGVNWKEDVGVSQMREMAILKRRQYGGVWGRSV